MLSTSDGRPRNFGTAAQATVLVAGPCLASAAGPWRQQEVKSGRHLVTGIVPARMCDAVFRREFSAAGARA